MPGVADTYQGTELWDLSLVDPDNRRPVDWDAAPGALLAALDGRRAGARRHRRRRSCTWWPGCCGCAASCPSVFLAGVVRGAGRRQRARSASCAASGWSRSPRPARCAVERTGWGDDAVELPDGRVARRRSPAPSRAGSVPLAELLSRLPGGGAASAGLDLGLGLGRGRRAAPAGAAARAARSGLLALSAYISASARRTSSSSVHASSGNQTSAPTDSRSSKPAPRAVVVRGERVQQPPPGSVRPGRRRRAAARTRRRPADRPGRRQREAARRTAAASAMARSPSRCPSTSLTCLRPSRSTNSSTRGARLPAGALELVLGEHEPAAAVVEAGQLVAEGDGLQGRLALAVQDDQAGAGGEQQRDDGERRRAGSERTRAPSNSSRVLRGQRRPARCGRPGRRTRPGPRRPRCRAARSRPRDRPARAAARAAGPARRWRRTSGAGEGQPAGVDDVAVPGRAVARARRRTAGGAARGRPRGRRAGPRSRPPEPPARAIASDVAGPDVHDARQRQHAGLGRAHGGAQRLPAGVVRRREQRRWRSSPRAAAPSGRAARRRRPGSAPPRRAPPAGRRWPGRRAWCSRPGRPRAGRRPRPR